MTSEKRAHKFHTDDVSLAGSTQIWVLLLIGRAAWQIFFRSYNLHLYSIIAIRRFLRQPFLEIGVYLCITEWYYQKFPTDMRNGK